MKTLIVGRTGSGKNTLQNILIKEYGWKAVKSYSTRKPRSEGEDTHIFISKEEAAAVPAEDKVAITFHKNGDSLDEYFATRQQVEEADCYIIDPKGVEMLTANMPEEDFQVIYVKACDRATQKQKAVERADDPELAAEIFDKRYASEDAQFTRFEKIIEDGPDISRNCSKYTYWYNDYTGGCLKNFAFLLNNTKTLYKNMLKVIPMLKDYRVLETDEDGKVLVTYKDYKQASVSDGRFAFLAMDDQEGMGRIMTAWLTLPAATWMLERGTEI